MHIFHRYRNWKLDHILEVDGEFSFRTYDVYIGFCEVCGWPKTKRLK